MDCVPPAPHYLLPTSSEYIKLMPKCFQQLQILALILALSGMYQSVTRSQSFGYEAELKVVNGNTGKIHRLSYFNKQYRREYNPGYMPNQVLELDPKKDIVEMYDGGASNIVWMLFPNHSATPHIKSIRYAYYRAAQHEGEIAVRQRYHLHSSHPFSDQVTYSTYSRIASLSSLQHSGGLIIHKTGKGMVAGYTCDRYDGVVTNSHAQPRDRLAVTIKPQTRGIRLWVEPKTNLILKSEQQVMYPGTRTPPSRTTVEVLKLKILKSIPHRIFQLPSGTKVGLPEVLKDATLPLDTIRFVQNAATGKVKRVANPK